jgi:anti-sigma factor RsiW
MTAGADGTDMTRSDEMACRELVEVVTAYLDDALEPDDRARLEHHLTACDGCHTYVEQMRQTILATAAIGPEVIPAEGLERLIRVYREYRGG